MIQLDPTAATAVDGLLTLATMARGDHPELSQWAETAGRRLAAGLDPDRALGLDPASLARVRRAERDRHLRQAWAAVSGDADLPNRQRALLLLGQISRFQGSLWPRLRDMPEPPAGLSPAQRSLFFALKSGNGRLPAYRRILDLCNPPAD